VDPVESLDFLEKREELGGAAPLDSNDVVISSGGRPRWGCLVAMWHHRRETRIGSAGS